MAYLLLSRDADGLLHLLSEGSFPSRQEALAELSTITGTPEFHSWSSEVFLVDLDAATPVLLVRPTASLPMSDIEISALEPPSVPVAASEPAPFEYAGVDYGLAETSFAEAPGEDEAEGVTGAAAFLADVETTPVGDGAIADAIVESASEQAPSASIGYGQPSREASGDELRAALRRSAAQMQDEGVEVPEPAAAVSGPAPVPESAATAPADEAAPTAPADESTPPPAEEPSERPAWPMAFAAAPAAPPAPAAATPVRAPAAPPVAAAEAVEQPEPAPAPAEAAEAPATVWRPEAAPDVGPVPDIESATVQEQTPVDSASFSGEPAAAQTAISTPWPWDVVTPEVPEAESAAVEPVEESPGVVQVGAAESQVAEVDETTPPVVAEGTSDFILDLDQPASGEPVFAAEPAAPLPGVQPPLSTALDAYVCDDCAYAETCPNKGQRLPKECGSFQWR